MAGLTQEELAARAGVSVRTISGLEGGTQRHAPYRETVRLLADALVLAPEDRAAFTCAAHSGKCSVTTTCAAPDNSFSAEQSGSTAPDAPACTQPICPPLSRPFAGLPTPPTPLIGRDADIASACAHVMRSEVRLLTLIGPPGVGKTRLGLAVGAAVAGDFADGVVCVALGSLADPQLVASAIFTAVAQALDLPLLGKGDLSARNALLASLRERRAVLLLDNFEHVLVAAKLVSEMLATCPGVKALVTSRAPLHVQGEQVFSVAPLVLPPTDDSASSAVAMAPTFELMDTAALAPAIRLLLDRAGRISPGFCLTLANRDTITAICRRLDGLPLALELAAARLNLLTPDELLQRLEQRLPLLTGGTRDAPERQQTLRTALAWSYDLLDAHEQAAFRRMAVFAGSASLLAAETICAATGSVTESHGSLDWLHALVGKSLLVCEDGATGRRLRMLETIREYAWEQLCVCGEADDAQREHAHYYAAYTEEADELPPPARSARYRSYVAELDNFRAALRWTMQRMDVADIQLGLRLAGTLGPYWYASGRLSEGQMWLHELLARADEHSDGHGDERAHNEADALNATLAKSTYMAGWIAADQGEYARAMPLLERSVTFYRRIGNPAALADALNRLGEATLAQGDADGAQALFTETLELRR
ncbi:MAG: tetratricopeptide repeat protein, partial [Ktedonobacterales bacterium]